MAINIQYWKNCCNNLIAGKVNCPKNRFKNNIKSKVNKNFLGFSFILTKYRRTIYCEFLNNTKINLHPINLFTPPGKWGIECSIKRNHPRHCNFGQNYDQCDLSCNRRFTNYGMDCRSIYLGGTVTLVVIELVLGIDNLVFIAIRR